jgi:protease-4
VDRYASLKLGLVDRLGNINDAIVMAAKKAKVDDYKLVSYPEQKSIFNKFGQGLTAEVKTRMLKSELGENYNTYQQIKSLTQMMRTPQARMPFDVVIK